ncbi:MAG: response regulator transcription factor [Balneola sp.]
MINYLIIDDEYLAHEVIKDYCDMLPNMELMKSCYDALEAFEYLSEHTVDLIFLDLNMPKLKGFEFLRALPHPPKVIVSTAYAEYALEGYELNISDYLLKPFSFERFLKAVNKAVGSSSKPVSTIVEVQPESSGSIFLKENKKYTQVQINSILYIEASGNYTKVVTKNETLTVREKISDLLSTFPAEGFIQVHKSFAVAVKHIKTVIGNRIFIEDYEIPVGKMYKSNLDSLIG